IAAGETGGVLESLLDKLAVYKEKTQAIKKKVKSALTYPIAIVVVAVVLVFIMMVFVLPAFGEVYSSMGAELPGLTQIVMSISDFFVKYAWVIVIGTVALCFGVYQWYKKSPVLQKRVDAMMLRLPIFGSIVRKATIARWARTTST
ncbi:type II secretion system protein F, partial [Neisseria canis]